MSHQEITTRYCVLSLSYLSQYNQEPDKRHWLLAKRILRYLRGTKNKILTDTGT